MFTSIIIGLVFIIAATIIVFLLETEAAAHEREKIVHIKTYTL